MKSYEIFTANFSQIINAENITAAIKYFDNDNDAEITSIKIADWLPSKEGESVEAIVNELRKKYDEEGGATNWEDYGTWLELQIVRTQAKAPAPVKKIPTIVDIALMEVDKTAKELNELKNATPAPVSGEDVRELARDYIEDKYGKGAYGRMMDKLKEAFISGYTAKGEGFSREKMEAAVNIIGEVCKEYERNKLNDGTIAEAKEFYTKYYASLPVSAGNKTNNQKYTTMPEHLQTETPTKLFAEWLVELYEVTIKETGLLQSEININTKEAYKWYKDGFTPYATFRETY